MKALQARASALANRQVRARLADLERELTEQFPTASVRQEDGAIIVSGRRIVRSWLHSSALRFLHWRHG